MDEVRWEALVRRIEPAARANPKAHRRKVFLLALLGYAFIALFALAFVALGVLVVVLALRSTGVLLKLLIPIGAILIAVVRALYVKFDPPSGVRVTKADTPELLAMVDDVRRSIEGPRLHRVLVDERANAAVVQVPRFGGLLGARSYLLVGLPYLLGLTAAELRAVIGHELGHLSRRHGRFGAFVYRVRTTWAQLLGSFEERRSIWTGLIRRFFSWYVPYFEAHTLPLARVHEFEADDAAAEVAGREAAASCLVSGLLTARWVDETYLPQVYGRADDLPSPPPTAFAPMVEEIAGAPRSGNADAAFKALLEEETEIDSSHPSLAERLAHLGVEPDEAFRLATTARGEPAADVYLAARRDAIVTEVERHWAAQVQPQWREAHAAALSARQRLRQLTNARERTSDDEFERASLTERFEDAKAAEPLYAALLDGDQDAPARFALGRIALARGDEGGLALLDDAMERDHDAVLPACDLVIGWLRERGRDDEAQRYVARAEAHVELLVEAWEEREGISVDDDLVASGLPDDVLDGVRLRIAWREQITEAYLVRKRVEKLADRPFFALAYVTRSGFRAAWREVSDEEDGLETVDDLLSRTIDVPGELMVVRVVPDSPIGRKIMAVEGALVYRKG